TTHQSGGSQYIDLEYKPAPGNRLNYSSILNPSGTPVTLTVNGTPIPLSTTPTPMVTVAMSDGTTTQTPLVPMSGESMADALLRTGVSRFRYTITQPNFTWPRGPVVVSIPAAAFKNEDTTVNGNTVTGTANVATTFNFTVVGATATVAGPGPGGSIDINA